MSVRSKKVSIWLAVVLTLVGVTVPEFTQKFRAEELPPPAPDASARNRWDAVAPGRVEPLSREIKISAPIAARIVDVLIKPDDKVFPGQLLVRLDDDEAIARVTAAEAQVALRKRARNDQATPSGSAERRKAEDAAADAEKAVADARAALDKTTVAKLAGSASDTDLDAARAALSRAQDRLREQQDALGKLKAASDTPLPSRLEGELNVARAELTLAQAVLEKTRIRAPAAATVLQVEAKKGEFAVPAVPAAEPALLSLGDMSALRVRAEVDERDIDKVRVGQRVVVRAAAVRDHDFEGKVASIARTVGPGHINSRGTRKFSDVDVLEVVVNLTDGGPLVVGQQVDVYFSSDSADQQASQ